MKLEDLRKSVSEMTDDELEQHIMEIRENRRTKRKVVAQKVQKAESKQKKSVSKLMATLSPEEIQLLLGSLLEDD